MQMKTATVVLLFAFLTSLFTLPLCSFPTHPRLFDPVELVEELFPLKLLESSLGAFFLHPLSQKNHTANSTEFYGSCHKNLKQQSNAKETTQHRTEENSTKIEKEKKVKSKVIEAFDALLPIPAIVSILGRPVPTANLEVAKTIMTMITSTAALPAIADFAQIAVDQMGSTQTSLFSDTPFGNADEGNQFRSSSNERSTNHGRGKKPIRNERTNNRPQLSPVGSAIVPFLPKPLEFISHSDQEFPPPDPVLTPYSNSVAMGPVLNTLLYRSVLPLSRAGFWKALNLFTTGVCNSYGKVPTKERDGMTREFITSLASERSSFTPVVFAGLALDCLSFVNTTQQLNCPPPEAYNPKSLAKMLFLRLSDVPEAYATVALDYFRVASIHYVDPSFRARINYETNSKASVNSDHITKITSTSNNLFRPPISRIPSPSLGSLVQSAGALTTVFERPSSVPKHSSRGEMNSTATFIGAKDPRLNYNAPFSTLEVIRIINHYNSLNGSDFFLEFPFKEYNMSLELLLKAAESSLGFAKPEVLNEGTNHVIDSFPLRQNVGPSSPLPPIANIIRTTFSDSRHRHLQAKSQPPMSKTKRLRSQQLGVFPQSVVVNNSPSIELK